MGTSQKRISKLLVNICKVLYFTSTPKIQIKIMTNCALKRINKKMENIKYYLLKNVWSNWYF